MRLHACCAGAMLLLFLVGQARAECSKVENPNVDPNDALQEYVCEGGTPADLDRLPDNVEMLRISNMPIGRITESMFTRFERSLLILTCSHCSISDIDDRAFRRLSSLQQLSLDNNRLKEVRGTWFEGLVDLTYLDLNYNGIERIESDVFRNAPNLVDFRVSGNRLECLDLESLSRLRGLKRIFVNENPNFGCPNAVKRFLAERRLDSEADPEWNSITYDRVQASAFGSSEPPVPPSFYPSSTPSAYTRPRWTEEPPTSPPTEPPTTEPPTLPPRRPYVPETVQPAVPDSSFSVPPYYPPQVTQQQIDHYRSTLAQQNWTPRIETTPPPPPPTTTMTTTTTTSTPEILIAGRAGPVTTTTECPSAASSVFRNSALLITTMVVLVARGFAL